MPESMHTKLTLPDPRQLSGELPLLVRLASLHTIEYGKPARYRDRIHLIANDGDGVGREEHALCGRGSCGGGSLVNGHLGLGIKAIPVATCPRCVEEARKMLPPNDQYYEEKRKLRGIRGTYSYHVRNLDFVYERV